MGPQTRFVGKRGTPIMVAGKRRQSRQFVQRRQIARTEASLRKARALRLRFSQSLASRRQRFNRAIVRSTIQRLGNGTNPLARSERLTISVLRLGRTLASAVWKIDPAYALSANSFARKGNWPNNVASNQMPPSRS